MTRDEIQKVRDLIKVHVADTGSSMDTDEALAILDRELAAPEQEPFCYVNVNAQGDVTRTIKREDKWCKTPLYRHPAPQSAQPMQWIDVSERVPDEAQIVLFVLKGKVVVGAWIAGIFWYDNAKQVASAWLPLPPPPELGVGGYPITAPPAAPAREWQDLSPLELRDTLRNCAASTFDKLVPHWYEVRQFAHAIEAALKAKNTGEQA